MKNRKLYIGISVVLIALAFLLISSNLFNITGRLGSMYVTCTESDDGDDMDVKGTITLVTHGREAVYTDYCFSKTGRGPEKWLNEYYCNVHENIDSRDYNCDSYGSLCVDGKCVKIEEGECIDNDGLDYNKQGTVCEGEQCKTDFCLDKIYVSEGYCKDGKKDSDIYKCPEGCKDGACVVEEELEEPEKIEEREEPGELEIEKESFLEKVKKFFRLG